MKKYLVTFFLIIAAVWTYFYLNKKQPILENANIKEKPTLCKELEAIFVRDQKYRIAADSLKNVHGENSYKVDSIYKIVNRIDSINLIRVTKILDSVGWPDHDVMGANGHNALFLVIQHSDLKTQEKYLHMVRDAAKKDLVPKSSLALLEDRILIKHGKKQIYGSQIAHDSVKNSYYVIPIEMPDSVDKRRFSVGLGPLSAYLMNWQIIWDIKQYKKDLRLIEAGEKLRRPK